MTKDVQHGGSLLFEVVASQRHTPFSDGNEKVLFRKIIAVFWFCVDFLKELEDISFGLSRAIPMRRSSGPLTLKENLSIIAVS